MQEISPSHLPNARCSKHPLAALLPESEVWPLLVEMAELLPCLRAEVPNLLARRKTFCSKGAEPVADVDQNWISSAGVLVSSFLELRLGHPAITVATREGSARNCRTARKNIRACLLTDHLEQTKPASPSCFPAVVFQVQFSIAETEMSETPSYHQMESAVASSTWDHPQDVPFLVVGISAVSVSIFAKVVEERFFRRQP